MEENPKVDKDYKKAFNLGYELAKELDLKAPMFKNESPNVTFKNPIQAGIFQYVNERQVLDKSVDKSSKTFKKRVINRTFGKNKGLTP